MYSKVSGRCVYITYYGIDRNLLIFHVLEVTCTGYLLHCKCTFIFFAKISAKFMFRWNIESLTSVLVTELTFFECVLTIFTLLLRLKLPCWRFNTTLKNSRENYSWTAYHENTRHVGFCCSETTFIFRSYYLFILILCMLHSLCAVLYRATFHTQIFSCEIVY